MHRSCNSVPDSVAFPTERRQMNKFFHCCNRIIRCWSGWVQISLTLSAVDTIKLTSYCVHTCIPNCIIFRAAQSYFSRVNILLLKTHWIFCDCHAEVLSHSTSLLTYAFSFVFVLFLLLLCLCATVQTSSAGIQWCASFCIVQSIMVP